MIRVHDLTVRFGEHTVFDRFCCEFPLDGRTLLRGVSGSGKSTLLRVLMGLTQPNMGTVEGLQGLKLSAVFQEDRLLPWLSVLDNVALVSDPQAAERALSALGLSDSLQQKPAELSGGMNRRAAIVRALAYGGDLLLLDEPFTGLDEANKQLVAQAVLDAHIPVIAAVHGEEDAALLAPNHMVQIG